MRRSLLFPVAGGLFFLLALVGCRQEQPEMPPPGMGRVEANQAYLQNFGQPPQGKAGSAFARVGYLPLRTSPEVVRAVPFFVFNKDDQLRQILGRLSDDKLVLPPDSPFYRPFPTDMEFTVTSPENGVLTVSLTAQQDWPAADMEAAGLAIAETALQFAEIEQVTILLNNEPLPQMPAEGYSHEPQRISEPGPPALVMMVGTWETKTGTLEEILIEFDRPVEVNQFRLSDAEGNEVAGSHFTSAFQMAVVIQPENPDRYQEGSLLRAEWDVVDDLGRANSGTDTLPLRHFEH